MTRNLLTIIIPVRQEEQSIGKTIKLLSKTVQTSHVILIADDTVEPDDKTMAVVENIKMKMDSRLPTRRCYASSVAGGRGNDNMIKNTILLSKKRTGDADGFGPALVRAIRRVKTEYLVFVMADSADNLKDIDKMVVQVKEKEVDVVVGCRYMRGGRKMGGPILQGIFSRMLNIFLYTVLRVPTRDSTNAFKLYKTAFVKKIVPTSPAIGIEFSLELLLRAVECGAKIIDMPTVWRGRTEGVSKVNIIPRGIRYMGVVEAWFLKT